MTSRVERDSQTYKQRLYEEKSGNGNSKNVTKAVYPLGEYDVSSVRPSGNRATLWQRLGLRTKATGIAVAISTLPILVIGATAYHLTDQKITESVTSQQQTSAISLANQIDRFTLERSRDIQLIAQLGLFNDPRVRTSTSEKEKQAVLDQYLGKGYDNIAVADLAGNIIYQSTGHPFTRFSTRDYFQEAIKTNRPVISSPIKTDNEYVIFVATPIVDTVTHQTIGVVESRTPVRYLNAQLQENNKGTESHSDFVSDRTGKIFVATSANYIGQDVKSVFPTTAAQLNKTDEVGSVTDTDQLDHKNYRISYAPVGIEGQPGLHWSAIVAQPTAEAFAASRWLVGTLAIGTVLEALLVGAIAAYLVNRGLRPVLHATNAVQKLGQGQLNTRLAVEGQDELAVLGSNINLMANQLQTLIHKQDAEAALTQQFTDISLRIRQSLNLQDILKTAVKEVRKVLKVDRVVIYRFNPDWNGTIVAESIVPGWTPAINQEIPDTCFQSEGTSLEQYKNGQVTTIDNIYQAGLSDCYIRLLERFEVKANLVAPILVENRLLGLMIAHQCSAGRNWQQSEIDLFTQFAIQVGFAIDQANLLEQVEKARQVAEIVSQEQRQQKENLQRQLMKLLNDVEEASRGDLTVRAEVTVGEIGTVADFFNAIVESLRQLVTSVKKAATQVNVSVGENEGAICQLADEAFKQAEEITRTLDSVEQMTLSIQAVADSAHQAAIVARTASDTAATSGVAMDRTVQSILNLRETVAETANKVKHLGESSQKISKVVFLINQIALQTNVLAINASIEAARAGEEGRGFAVVAEEVGGLAAQSAAATKEIEQIVENIQRETSEVVKAMELGTTQVIEGTHLVEDTKQSLGQILDVSRQIDQLVQSISTATVSQAQTSQAVTHLMKDIARVSERTSNSSRQVSGSLQQTVEVAKQLQASVGAFKVGAEN